MTASPPAWIEVSPGVEAALADGSPVVALESAVITHGLPHPTNLETALALEATVRAAGVEPATIAALDGTFYVGLDSQRLRALASVDRPLKISRRDIAAAVAGGLSGGTTVSATMVVAHSVGIEVFATGAIGGVHRGGTGDVSADLPELARTRVAVVCAGAKSILDLPRTLEWLETAGVPVLGYRTVEFPAFYSRHSGLPLRFDFSDLEELARFAHLHWQVPASGGLVVAAPCPPEHALEQDYLEAIMEAAQAAAHRAGISGTDLTPYLLSELARQSDGATLQANRALLLNNAALAAGLARALTGQSAAPGTAG